MSPKRREPLRGGSTAQNHGAREAKITATGDAKQARWAILTTWRMGRVMLRDSSTETVAARIRATTI